MKSNQRKKKIQIRKTDFHRVVLTDVHPYEIPFIITNEGFYHNLKDGIIHSSNELNKILIKTRENDTKPFNYEIAKDKEDTRKLFLPHPSAQISISSIYKDYNQLIIYLCARSKYSLRYPAAIATYYRERVLDKNSNNSADEALRGEGVSINEPKYASSFFEYRKFSFLYKFYDSYDFHRIERKFNKLMKFDIAKCFSSISTFMIPISLKGNIRYKSDINAYNFENEISNVMSSMYDGNTHGIIVGPEFSRIFAEILLQSIDVDIENVCKKIGYEHGSHYEIRRYVDDFFLFFNDETVRYRVFSEIKKVLEKYKLFINESKNLLTETPFITGVSIAKKNIGDEISSFFALFSFNAESDSYEVSNDLRRYYQISNRMITDIKAVVAEHSVAYSSISGYFFTMVRINVANIREKVENGSFNTDQSDRLVRLFLILIDYMFFVYQNDFRVRSTYIVSQIIIMINAIFLNSEPESRSQITKKIRDEIISSITFANRRSFLRHVESLNLLIALKVIGELKSLSTESLEKYLGFSHFDVDHIDYFNIVVFLYLAGNENEYSETKNKLIQLVRLKLNKKSEKITENSESAHIFFDLVSCPYLDINQKIEIIKIVNETTNLGLDSDELQHEFLNFVSSRSWFVDWSANDIGHIEKLLLKKELKSPYS